jgi:Tol biopolymer transport system component/DNA-binding winged helix-turn-helix (wHTH) protein
VKSEFRLGPYSVCPSRYVIEFEGQTIHLEPKVMQVLLYLAERSGQVVAKEELFQAIWPNTFVTDDVLKRCVSQLRKALGDDSRDPKVVETIAKGGYRLLLAVDRPTGNDLSGLTGTAPSRGRWLVSTAVALVLISSVAFIWHRRSSSFESLSGEWHIQPLSTLVGWHGRPSFSPDGESVVFHYVPENSGPDIYVQLLGDERAVRLTHDQASICPTWSPAGPFIAYNQRVDLRPGEHVRAIKVMTALGGSHRVLARATADDRLCKISWSPDGRTLVYSNDPAGERSGLFTVSIDGGPVRRLTTAPFATTDSDAAFSPDGSQIAFVRERTIYASDLFLVAAQGGEPRQLTFLNAGVWSPNWIGDGRIIFSLGGYVEGMHAAVTSTGERVTSGLYVLSVRDGRFQRLPLPQTNIMNPALSKNGALIAYEKYAFSMSTWEVSLDGGEPVKLIAATGEANAVYSPNGRRIAFVSVREGHMGIWVCDSHGADCARLAEVQNGGSPDWSPNERVIVFDDRSSGRSHIYSVNVFDLQRRQLTAGDFDDTVPIFSLDGKELYFGSNRSGRFEIRKLTLGTNKTVQVTRGGGQYPQESPDRKFIYYTKVPDGDATREIWRVAASGGIEERVLAEANQNWRIRPDGIYFAARTEDRKPVLKRFDLQTGRIKEVARLTQPVTIIGRNLSISPDGSRAIYGQFDASSNQIMIATRTPALLKRP